MPDTRNNFRPAAVTLYPSGPGALSSSGADSSGHRPAQNSQVLEYWFAVRSNLGVTCLLVLGGLAAGWFYAATQHPMYQSKTVLDIQSLNENFLNEQSASTRTTDSVLPESYIQTEIKILQSDLVRKRAVDKLLGDSKAKDQKPQASFWPSMLGPLAPSTLSFKDLVNDAAKRVKVRAVGNTRIIEVLCDAKDGQLAASMCNTLAQSYIGNNLESRAQSSKDTSDWLESQLDDVRRRLNKAESDLRDAGKTSDAGTPAEIENPAQERLRQLQSQLSNAQAERIGKEAAFRVAMSHDANSMPLDMDTGAIREYRMKLADLESQLTEMQRTMTPDHYKVREQKAQVEQAERALKNERTGLIGRLQADLEAAQRRESMLQAAYTQQEALVSQGDSLAVRYNMLKSDVDSERRLYESLLQKVGEVGLSAALRTSTISIVDPAVAPLEPYAPNMTASVGVGLFGGSILGLAFSVLRTRSDRTLRAPGEAALHLQLRELGVIPSISRRKSNLLLPRPEKPLLSKIGLPETAAQPLAAGDWGNVLAPAASSRTSAALATWLGIREASEAFFGTMNSLVFSGAQPSGPAPRVIVTTSPAPEDGKTTVATNLATALASIGRRVILVDGDLRRPKLHTIFGAPAENGLAQYLEEEGSAPRSMEELVWQTSIPNLYLLPTTPAQSDVSSRLHSSRLRSLIQWLREEFAVVIIDSPPMSGISDARVLGWLADGVVLVFRARKTTREAALAAYNCFAEDGTHVIGTVLNDWNSRGQDYGAYGPLRSRQTPKSKSKHR